MGVREFGVGVAIRAAWVLILGLRAVAALRWRRPPRSGESGSEEMAGGS